MEGEGREKGGVREYCEIIKTHAQINKCIDY